MDASNPHKEQKMQEEWLSSLGHSLLCFMFMKIFRTNDLSFNLSQEEFELCLVS